MIKLKGKGFWNRLAIALIPYLISFLYGWVVRYNGPANGSDEARAIALDDSGNIYVTGRSWSTNSGYDYATIKYNQRGVMLWAVRYNGPGNDDDEPLAMAIDDSGNIYVTGKSKGLGTGYDYATIKYDKRQGLRRWVARYNGPGNGDDEPYGIALDRFGNVYITGASKGVNTYLDYATIKYNRQGVMEWVKRYDGAEDDDEAFAIGVDYFGNVYITGRSCNDEGDYDYLTIKYDTQGNRKWLDRYNGTEDGEDEAYSLVLDGFGNVHITGTSEDSFGDCNCLTIKYYSQGGRHWIARYKSSGEEENFGRAIAVDDSGNVYVIGVSSFWTNSFYTTIKYNFQGEEQWVAREEALWEEKDIAPVVALDSFGNVYVAGRCLGREGSSNYLTIKYNADGIKEGAARYNGPGNGEDEVSAIALNPLGDICITGRSQGLGTGFDYATIKAGGDVGVTTILLPEVVDSGFPIVPSCSVFNYGFRTVNYQVRMKIGSFYNQTASIFQHLSDTFQYLTFPTWTPFQVGLHFVSCSTELTGDIDNRNDKQMGSIFVRRRDVAVDTILSPMDTVSKGPLIPKVRVYNHGNFPESFMVRFLIEGTDTIFYSDSGIVRDLPPDTFCDIKLSLWVAPPGNYLVRSFTCLEEDFYHSNDTTTFPFTVISPEHDVGVLFILSPSEITPSNDWVTPKARIYNYGQNPEDFRAYFSIQSETGLVYKDSSDISCLLPDSFLDIIFSPWLATLGRYFAKCTTALVVDENRRNDREIIQFFVTIIPPGGGWQKLAVSVPDFPDGERIRSGGYITAGKEKIYILKGNNTKSLYSFVPESAPVWIADVPIVGASGIKKGSAMVYDGERYLYIVPGSNTREFWRLDTEDESTWVRLDDIPEGRGNLKGGTGIAYVNGNIYLLKGSKTDEFYKFDISQDTWLPLANAPEGIYIGRGYPNGSCLVALNESTLYALRGKYNEFYKYKISANSWIRESGMPCYHPMWNKKRKVGEGASLTIKDGVVYAFKGNNTKEFWVFDHLSGLWIPQETIPKGKERKYVKGGGGLCTYRGTIYAIKGNNTDVIYKYIRSNNFTVSSPNSRIGEWKRATGELNCKTFLRINSNPTRGLTTIYYNLPRRSITTLKIYNILGELLYSEVTDKGFFTIKKKLPAGIYFLHFETSAFGDPPVSPDEARTLPQRDGRGYKVEKKIVIME